MGLKSKQKKSERKALIRKYKLSMRAGKVTCHQCGKKWASLDEFSADMVLCGGAHCTIRDKREEATKEASNVIQIIQNRSRYKKKPQEEIGEVDKSYDGITVNIRTGSVDDEYGRVRTEACYYEDVPKVIAVEIRKVRTA